MPKNRLRSLVSRRKTSSSNDVSQISTQAMAFANDSPAPGSRASRSILHPLAMSAALPRPSHNSDKIQPTLTKNQSYSNVRQLGVSGPEPATPRTFAQRHGLSLVLPSSPYEIQVLSQKKNSPQIIKIQTFFRMLRYRLMLKKYCKFLRVYIQ
jgi:hypothetical protein